jgi:hypothetical protein
MGKIDTRQDFLFSSAGDSADHDEWLFAGYHSLRQGGVRRFMGEIFFASEKTQESPPLQGVMIANCATQHRIMRLQGVEHRTLGDGALDWQGNFTADMRQISEMEWEHYADRGH